MNWKKYEKEILMYFQETFPETSISFDQTIIGKFSKTGRQIDILIEGEVAGYDIKIIVDCKYFSKNIDVKQVESFCSMVEDVEAHQGVLITQKGFSKAAINRAYYGNHKVELDIINFDELKKFQSFTALAYSGHFSAIVPAPFGWVLDLKDRINSFASLHQRGLTLGEAQKRNEWMYMQFWTKDDRARDIDELIEFQNINILDADPGTKFTYNSLVKRKDGSKTKIRIADVSTYPSLEVTGFIEFEEHIYFVVLFTPKELLNKNLRKLQYLLKVAIPTRIDFNNHAVIKQRLAEIDKTESKEKQADIYYQVGIWYQEMDDVDNALINYNKAIECFPTHYTYLKNIIGKTLSWGLIPESKTYAKQFFEVEPKNPRVPQDLIRIYLELKKSDVLIELFNELISKNKDLEVLGNLYLHLGQLYFFIGKEMDAEKNIAAAKQHFEKVLPKDHQAFKSIAAFYEREKPRIT